MKIIELRTSGFARLRAVEIRPDGALVPVTGKNGAGKSSVLRSIWVALQGRAVAPPQPINESAERAVIRLDLGEMIVQRTFTRARHGDVTTGLSVTMADGTRVATKPQQMIDALLGDLSFDPLALARMAPKEQLARLRRLVTGVDFDEIAALRAELYAERTRVNRMAATARALADKVDLPPGPEPAAVDTAGIAVKLMAATEINTRRIAQVNRARDERYRAERQLDEAEQLRARAGALEKEGSEANARADQIVAALPEVVDVTALAAELASAQSVELVRRLHEQRRGDIAAADQREAESQALTDRMSGLDRKVRDAIANAKLPAGLELGEDGVLLNGLPFEQAGTAEKIMASAAAGMAMEPKLRVMLVDEGSELDSEGMSALAELAAAHDYQIWVARVEEGEGGAGFRIEDGRLAEKREAAE